MSSLIAYFLGILTILVIIVPFWYLAKVNKRIEPVYKNVFCKNIN